MRSYTEIYIYIAFPLRTDAKTASYGMYQIDSITLLTPSVLASYVSFVTGNKRKLTEETQ